jgi:hypothetical protein
MIKNNIHHHYGSSGECFSFGLHNSYKSSTSNGITITHHAGDYLSLLCTFNTFYTIIPGISKDFYILARTLKEMSKNSPLLKMFHQNYNNSCTDSFTFSVSGNVNVNTATKNLHCKCDITYTTIHVPSQNELSSHVIFDITYTTIHVPSQNELSSHIIFESLPNEKLSMKKSNAT